MGVFYSDKVDSKGKAIKKVPCKLCEQVLADGGGTTNLLNHLQAKHPEEFKRCSFEGRQSTSKQSSISNIFRNCSAQHAAAITDKVADFVAMDLHPLSIVDGRGFKQLFSYIEPGYSLPSRTHLTGICQRKFKTVKEELLATLESLPYVSVTSDIWTSRVTQAYITLTVYFITNTWKMESKVLQTQEMPTGEHISLRLSSASQQWKIKDKIVALVRDNAANMVLASQLLDDGDDMPCFAHTLQLAVKAGLDLPLITRVSAVCRKIIGHFKHSVRAMEEKQKSMNISQHSLIQDVSTRWNSTYFMYEQLIEQRWAIYAVIHDENITSSDQRHLDLKPEQWELLSQLSVVLRLPQQL